MPSACKDLGLMRMRVGEEHLSQETVTKENISNCAVKSKGRKPPQGEVRDRGQTGTNSFHHHRQRITTIRTQGTSKAREDCGSQCCGRVGWKQDQNAGKEAYGLGASGKKSAQPHS